MIFQVAVFHLSCYVLYKFDRLSYHVIAMYDNLIIVYSDIPESKAFDNGVTLLHQHHNLVCVGC